MGIRTGQQYLDGLRDDREIWCDGERVKDVTTDPRFAGGARTQAELYDLQHKPDLIDQMTYVSPTSGDRVGLSFIQPRSTEDLAARRTMFKIWNDYTCGMFGRSPDFMNVMFSSYAAAHEAFDTEHSKFGKNMVAYYEFMRENDLASTHALVSPQVDRSKAPDSQEKDIAARIVGDNDKGFIINGVRMLATLAAISDELMVMPAPSYPLSDKEEAKDHAFGFAIPVATPGLKLIARPSVVHQNAGSPMDYPLSEHFDDSDCMILFDNVLVPWERTFIYSPLHGVGLTAVKPVLKADGFTQLEIYQPHAKPDGDFPNVPDHVANPENPEVFSAIIAQARDEAADLILATDPDCDRLGCAAPVTTDTSGAWATFNGNQICALLADFVLDKRQQQGGLSADHFVVKTLVTTDMVKRIADSYGVRTVGDLMVGFKWIGGAMDEFGPEKFLFGAEESHGYLVGQYARDKDAAVAAMLMSELAAELKANGQTLHEKLAALYWQHGYHAERLLNLKMAGSEGMARMLALMAKLRAEPPAELAGQKVVRVRDYQQGQQWAPGEAPTPLAGPRGDMVMLDLAENGNYIAVRPSGTEPKVKFYEFAFVPAEQLADLESTKTEIQRRLDQIESDLRSYADAVE